MRDTFTVSIQQLNPVLGDVSGNRAVAEAACRAADADLVVFPELFLSGAPPHDLARMHGFARRCMAEAEALAAALAAGPAVAIGTPWLEEGRLTNACAVLQGGAVAVVRHKVEVQDGPPFDEARVFASADMPGPVDIDGVRVGLPIGEDLFGADVVECLAETGAEILIVPTASPFTPVEADRRLNVAVARVVESELPLVIVNAVGGHDEWVFDGASFALGADRRLTHQLPAFVPASARLVFRRGPRGGTLEPGLSATIPDGAAARWAAAVLGLRDAVRKAGAGRIVLELAGGVDAAVAAALAVDALGADAVDAVVFDPPPEAAAAALATTLGLAPRPVALAPALRAVDGLALGSAGAAELRAGIARGVLGALAEDGGALVVRAGSATAIALGQGPVGGGLNPIGDLDRTDVKALAHWRDVHRPDGALGPAGPLFPPPLLAAPIGLGADAPEDVVLDAILGALLERDADVDELVAEGYEADTVRRLARRVTDGEAMRRRATPRLRLAPRPAGDRRYPITNRYRDA